jgi:hypothetical protein
MKRMKQAGVLRKAIILLPVLEKHGGSNWARPGTEWGTAFKFPTAGCWDLHVTGGKTVGDVWVIIS